MRGTEGLPGPQGTSTKFCIATFDYKLFDLLVGARGSDGAIGPLGPSVKAKFYCNSITKVIFLF